MVIPYRDTNDMFIVGDVDEIMTMLDDHQVTAQTMMASRYIDMLCVVCLYAAEVAMK